MGNRSSALSFSDISAATLFATLLPWLESIEKMLKKIIPMIPVNRTTARMRSVL